MGTVDPEDLEPRLSTEEMGLAWGVEVELADLDDKSTFFSARKVVLDGLYAQIQLLDGSYETFPVELVRKVMAMRASTPGYTGEDLSADELY